jgi:hypothetical protein
LASWIEFDCSNPPYRTEQLGAQQAALLFYTVIAVTDSPDIYARVQKVEFGWSVVYLYNPAAHVYKGTL